MEMFDALEAVTKPLFRDMLTSGSLSSDSRRPVTFIIADGILGFAIDVAKEIGLPIVCSRTISPSSLWVFLCLPKLVEAGELPFRGSDLDALIKSVPGMEGFLQRRDLPSCCRTSDLTDPNIQLYLKESQVVPRADGLILNTFEDLEGPILSQIRNLYPKRAGERERKSRLSVADGVTTPHWPVPGCRW